MQKTDGRLLFFFVVVVAIVCFNTNKAELKGQNLLCLSELYKTCFLKK
jgi:hypothetical protein